MVFSIVKNLVNGLSGKTASKATQAATDASLTATRENNALAQNVYNDQKATLAPFVAQGGPATSYINGLLGIGTPAQTAAANAGYDAYKASSGYAARLDEGKRQITNNQAVSGLLNSGSTLKGLDKFGQDYASNDRNNYINQLAAQQGVGLSAASAQAGVANSYSSQVQNNNSTNATNVGNAALAGAASKNSMINGLISAAGSAAAFSDPRLKLDIDRVGTLHDGLPLYEWTYIPELEPLYGDGRYRGVMADDVAKYRPHALGPIIEGFATVDYERLGG